MKKTFSISEMSHITDIPVNTLKHYDRIGLFKPAIVKPDSLYRYYTLDQIYTLILIKDLRGINMSIQDIRDYLDKRNVSKSLDILERKLTETEAELEALKKRRYYLQNKLNTLKTSNSLRYEINEVVKKVLPDRWVISYGVCIKDNDDKYFASRQLEKSITDATPGIICCTHGAFIPREELERGELKGSAIAFALIHTKDNDDYSEIQRTIPGGHYLCSYYAGRMFDREDCLRRLLSYMRENNITLAGDALQINYIDDNITDCDNEFLYEIQIPVAPR